MQLQYREEIRLKRITMCRSIMCIILLVCLFYISDVVQAETLKVKAPINLHVVKETKHSLRITWNLVEGVDGYEIYRCKWGNKEFKKVKDIKNSKTKKWVNKKLKENTIYRYQIKAYKIVNGVRVRSESAYIISAKTHTKKCKKVNANRVIPEVDSIEIGMGMTREMSANVKVLKKGKAAYNENVNWYSTDKSIASITKDGMLTANKKEGKCYIYAKAHNGKNSKKIPVEIVNQSMPKNFEMENVTGSAKILLKKYKNEVCKIAEFFTQHPLEEEGWISYEDEEGYDIEPAGLNVANIQSELDNIFMEFEYGDALTIMVEKEKVVFTITEELEDGTLICQTIEYYFREYIDDSYWEEGYYEIAEHWGYAYETNEE